MAASKHSNIRGALRELDTAVVDADPALLANTNTPSELAALSLGHVTPRD